MSSEEKINELTKKIDALHQQIITSEIKALLLNEVDPKLRDPESINALKKLEEEAKDVRATTIIIKEELSKISSHLKKSREELHTVFFKKRSNSEPILSTKKLEPIAPCESPSSNSGCDSQINEDSYESEGDQVPSDSDSTPSPRTPE